MKKNHIQFFVAVLFFLFCSVAGANAPLLLDKNYVVVSSSDFHHNETPGKIQVIEFFNYGCPACNRLEPFLEKWLAKKPANVDFQRIPVAFEPGWNITAKTFYLVNALNLETKLNPLIFKAIHEQGLDFTNIHSLKEFLKQHGISNQQFEDAFNTPSMNLSLEQGKKMMMDYQVMEIPSFVVAGKYKTSAGMTKGDDKLLLTIVDQLIEKASKETKGAPVA